MNWFEKIAKKGLVDEIRRWGWSEDQLRLDGFDIWKKDNKFFVSSGDWAQIPNSDIFSAIKNIYPGADVDGDAECGPPGDDWEKIF